MVTFTPEQLVEMPDDQLQYLSPEQLEQRDALFRQEWLENQMRNSKDLLTEVKLPPDE